MVILCAMETWGVLITLLFISSVFAILSLNLFDFNLDMKREENLYYLLEMMGFEV